MPDFRKLRRPDRNSASKLPCCHVMLIYTALPFWQKVPKSIAMKVEGTKKKHRIFVI